MRQLIGPLLEFSIAQLSIFANDGNSIWGALRLLLEEPMDAFILGILSVTVPARLCLMRVQLFSSCYNYDKDDFSPFSTP
jgi:hypothetical protein